MTDTTRQMVKAIEGDTSLTQAEREMLRSMRRGEVEKPPTTERLLRRGEVASRCSCTLRTVDRWVKAGALVKVKIPGFARASGIPESAVNALIAGAVKETAAVIKM